MTEADFLAAMEATWPPAAVQMLGPVRLRDGQGGGKRVSAASVVGDWTGADLDRAEQAMRARGQRPLFQVVSGQDALDQVLAARAYAVVDPVLAYLAPAAALSHPAPHAMEAFTLWPPLEIAREIWAEGGIGPARLAVMERAKGPKCVVLARSNDRPSGVAYVALHGRLAVLHALEVRPAQRRAGAATAILRMAAGWARDQGAESLGLVVTEKNAPARALYEGLGMRVLGRYHYREAPMTGMNRP